MKNKASVFLKQIISVLSSVVKAKTLALKNKTSAFNSRLIILSFLKNKKLFLSSITHKIHALVASQHHHHHHHHDNIMEAATDEHDDVQNSKAIVLYDQAMANDSANSYPSCTELVKVKMDDDDDDDNYPDLTHSLFDSLDEADPGGSVIDLVRNCKEDRENFNLEDEIDQVADLFIRRFHKQMKMQKLDSFKRYQEMLERSV
ncbi:hypothetical protein NE237_019996 [Protea cynaroides]|uniref:Cotton fiber protein n=1 Tax=Protea cynaroides TaxID=273540 RepID=A0A9Q0H7J7_9MAGN|nr:hypothetical protein NE237_019996 [Protea cynaroides]